MALLLLVASLTVACWEILAWRSRLPHASIPPDERYAGFQPQLAAWHVESIKPPSDPQQINIVSFILSRRYPAVRIERVPVQTRLVHGYNMHDCMRIKGYRVELLEDTREGDVFPVQAWLLTSASGDRSVWITTMVASRDLDPTKMDVRSIPFPRVGTPDELGWSVRGLSWGSLRHPVEGLETFLRSRWNASRCDWATFLKLRRPAWVGTGVLTLVSSAPLRHREDALELEKHVMVAHIALHHALLEGASKDATAEAPLQ